MSYHEISLSKYEVGISYGVSARSWDLPLSIGVGGPGYHERGFNIGVLCFWFAINWWPLAYPLPSSVPYKDGWDQQFKRVEDFGYQLEGLDIEVGQIEALARRARNAVDVLRDLHDGMHKERATNS